MGLTGLNLNVPGMYLDLTLTACYVQQIFHWLIIHKHKSDKQNSQKIDEKIIEKTIISWNQLKSAMLIIFEFHSCLKTNGSTQKVMSSSIMVSQSLLVPCLGSTLLPSVQEQSRPSLPSSPLTLLAATLRSAMAFSTACVLQGQAGTIIGLSRKEISSSEIFLSSSSPIPKSEVLQQSNISSLLMTNKELNNQSVKKCDLVRIS